MEKPSGHAAALPLALSYCRDINPAYIDFVLLLNGFEPPNRSPLRYLELGFGQGISANIHAAASQGEFFGTDFQTTNAANAQSLAEISRCGARFGDDDFGTLAQSNSLPEFDYITMNGVWSWITPESRDHVTAIIGKHLRPGGVAYLNYNTLPGWATAAPIQHLMALQMRLTGSDNVAVLDRINHAVNFAKLLAEKNAGYFVANQAAKDSLAQISAQNRLVLAHEYFNEGWASMYSAEVHDRLALSRGTFACSANPLDGMASLSLQPEQMEILAAIPNAILRETVRDYLLNTAFRRDLFIRGPRRMSASENLERLKQARLVLTTSQDDVGFSLQTPVGQLALKKEIYEPFVEMLAADDYKPKYIRDLSDRLDRDGAPSGAAIEAAAILVGLGVVAPAQNDEDSAKVVGSCHRLNQHLIAQSVTPGCAEFLASPVTGGGIYVDRLQQMFLRAKAHGKQEPSAWAEEVWSVIKGQGQAMVVDGKALETDAENLAEVKKRATLFADTRLDVLKALQVTA